MAGVVLFLFFASLWYLSGGKWMGFGDAKLALGVGFLLGFWRGLSAIVLAFWIGAAVGLLLIGLSKIRLPRALAGWITLHRRVFSIKSEVPFAPFIVIGFVLSLIFNLNVFYFF
jgi:leader peptidase (prepilin peptidase)/N-methyltransferase